jgi:hypothetical protein
MSSSPVSNLSGIAFGTMPTSTFSHMVVVKLNEENNLLWSAQVLPYLWSQGLNGYIDGSLPTPSQTIFVTPSESTDGRSVVINPEYATWYHEDQLVLSVINSSLTKEILSIIVDVTSARDAWARLEQMYASRSKVRVMQIRMQLATIQKKDLSIADYYKSVKHLGDTLAAIGKRLEDEEPISYLWCGLGPDYDPLVTSITTRVDTITLSDVYAYMLSFEMRQENNNINSALVGQVPLANVAGRGVVHGGSVFGHDNRGRGWGNGGRGGHSSRSPARA